MKSRFTRFTSDLFQKKNLVLPILLFGGILTSFSEVQARLIFTTEDDGVNAEAYHIDNDDSSTTFIDLAFGSGATNLFRFDTVLDKFIINNDLDVQGNVSITSGNLNLNGNEIIDFLIENQAAAPTCDVSHGGRMYYNTTDDNLYFCNATTTTWTNSSNITAGSITGSDLAAAVAGAGLIKDGSDNLEVNVDGSTIEITGDALNVVAGGITATELAAGAVSGGLLGIITDNSITADDIATSAVTTDEILNATILGEDLAAGAISGGNLGVIADNTITADDIATSAVTTDEILNATILGEDIAAGAISGGALGLIADNTITADDLATGSVASDEILDGTIVLADIAARDISDNYLTPEYPNFTIYADTTANSGTLSSDYDNTNKVNYYRWTSKKPALNDYDVIVQFPIPENFTGFDHGALEEIKLDMRTSVANAGDVKIDVLAFDTTGAAIALGGDGGTALTTVANTWTTKNITFDEAADCAGVCTFTPGENIRFELKLYARNLEMIDVSNIELNYQGK